MFKHFKTLSSTNDYCLEYAKTHPGEPLVCSADTQTKGRGRGGKAWDSTLEDNLYFSYLCPIVSPVESLAAITLVAGCVLAKYLKEMGIADVAIKWPNDIFIQSKKVAGILTEVAHGGKSNAVVIGIGLNLYPPRADLNQDVTAVKQHLSSVPDKQAIVMALVDALDEAIDRFEAKGFADFMDEWAAFDALKGKAITWVDGIRNGEAIVQGIDAMGHLLIDEEPFVLTSGSVRLKR